MPAGVWWILAIGCGLLVIAALADWTSLRRSTRAVDQTLAEADARLTNDRLTNDRLTNDRLTNDRLTNDRGTDHRGQPLPAPEYLSRAEALSGLGNRAPLDPEQAAALVTALAPSAEFAQVCISSSVVDERLFTHREPDRAVLAEALVLVVSDGIGSMREALQTLERAARQREPLLLLGSEFDPEVVDALVVNLAQRRLLAIAVRADSAQQAQVAELTGASTLSRADLQSGYVPHSAFGRATWVVADTEATTIVVSTDSTPKPSPEVSSED